MNILGFCSNLVDCEYFLESKSPDILALCETNLDDPIESVNFSVRDYLPLIWKDSSIHMHGLAVYMKKGLLFLHWIYLKKTLLFLTYIFAWLHSVSYFFFLYWSPSLSLCTIFYFISSNIDKVLQSTHLLCLSLETLASIIRTGWPILMDFVIICLSQTTLLRWLTFLLRSLTVILTVLPFRFYFFIWCYYLFYIQ